MDEEIQRQRQKLEEEILDRQEEFHAIAHSFASTCQMLINAGHEKSIIYASLLEFTGVMIGLTIIDAQAVMPLTRKFADLLLHGMAIRQNELNNREEC